MKRSIAAALVLLFAWLCVSGASGQAIENQSKERAAQSAVRPPNVSSGPTEKSVKAGETTHTLSEKLQLGAPEHVTWGYFRMQHPEAIISMLQAVQAKKIPASALIGLAPETTRSRLLKTDLSTLAKVPAEERPGAAIKKPGETPAGKPVRDDVVQGVVGGTGDVVSGAFGRGGVLNPWNQSSISAAELPPDMPLIKFNLDKSKLDMGSLFYGQKAYQTVTFTAPEDGEIHASVPKGSALRVVRVTTYSGLIKLTQKSATRSIASTDKLAAALPAKAGQDFAVLVECVLTKENAKEGAYKSELLVSCGHALATLPVVAKCLGVQYGIAASADDTDHCALPGQDLDINLTFTNEGQPGDCSIAAVEVPQGLTVDPFQKLHLDKGETQKQNLTVRIKPGTPEDLNATLVMELTQGPVKSRFPITLNILTDWVVIPITLVGGKAELIGSNTVTVNGSFEARPDGYFRWSGSVTQAGQTIVHANCDALVSLTANNFQSHGGTGDFHGTGTFDATGTDGRIKDAYTAIAEGKGSALKASFDCVTYIGP